MRRKANILLIIVDSLSFANTFGEKRNTVTPNIDKLYRDGTAFQNAIASSTLTTPSIASILTGNYSFSHGIKTLYSHKLNPKGKTFVEDLKTHGYHTYSFVTGPLVEEMGLTNGFDEYHYRDRRMDLSTEFGNRLICRFEKKEFKTPWFVLLHLWEVHRPYSISKGYNHRKYGKTRYERAVSSMDSRLGTILRTIEPNTIVVFTSDHGEQTKGTFLQEYISALRTDIYLFLKRRGWSKKRYRDIRKAFGGHGFNLYDDTIRIPLIFLNHDSFPKNTFIKTLARQIDIFPTLFDALSLPCTFPHLGKSLIPMIRGERIGLDAYIETSGMMCIQQEEWIEGIRTDRYKLIYSPYAKERDYELYDLTIDPEERDNIAHKRPDIVEALESTIVRIKAQGVANRGFPPLNRVEEERLKQRLKDLGYL